MNRRLFLQRAMIGASALAIDPERLLWTPGKKTFFIPPPVQKSTIRLAFFQLEWHEETETRLGRCDVFYHPKYNAFFRVEVYEQR